MASRSMIEKTRASEVGQAGLSQALADAVPASDAVANGHTEDIGLPSENGPDPGGLAQTELNDRSQEMKSLFRSFSLKSLKLKNRIIMAPMTRSFSPNGIPTPEVAAYYGRRAGEVGLIISEGPS